MCFERSSVPSSAGFIGLPVLAPLHRYFQQGAEQKGIAWLTPAKPSPAQPPASRTQTQGPASSQTYGEEERLSNRFSYGHTRIAFACRAIFAEPAQTLLPLGCRCRLSAAAPFPFDPLRRSSQQSFWFWWAKPGHSLFFPQ